MPVSLSQSDASWKLHGVRRRETLGGGRGFVDRSDVADPVADPRCRRRGRGCCEGRGASRPAARSGTVSRGCFACHMKVVRRVSDRRGSMKHATLRHGHTVAEPNTNGPLPVVAQVGEEQWCAEMLGQDNARGRKATGEGGGRKRGRLTMTWCRAGHNRGSCVQRAARCGCGRGDGVRCCSRCCQGAESRR